MLARVPCRYSFADLFEAAVGRQMTESEAAGFRSLPQPEKNRKVKELCALTDGRFVWEDRVGWNGVTFTAFSPPRGAGRLLRRRRSAPSSADAPAVVP